MIYVNGDSYAVYSGGKRYSDYLGEILNCKSINCAINGSCNNRILRTSLRDLIDLRNELTENITAVISLSFVVRTEVWDSNVLNNKFVNDGEFVSIQPTHSKSWFQNKDTSIDLKYRDFSKQFLLNYNIEAEITKLLQNIILFTSWCRSNSVNYIIFSSCLQEPIDFSAPFVKNFYDAVSYDKNIIDLFNFSFTEWCLAHNFQPLHNTTQEIHSKVYNIGHHGEIAHYAFAKYLYDNYFI